MGGQGRWSSKKADAGGSSSSEADMMTGGQQFVNSIGVTYLWVVRSESRRSERQQRRRRQRKARQRLVQVRGSCRHQEARRPSRCRRELGRRDGPGDEATLERRKREAAQTAGKTRGRQVEASDATAAVARREGEYRARWRARGRWRMMRVVEDLGRELLQRAAGLSATVPRR